MLDYSSERDEYAGDGSAVGADWKQRWLKVKALSLQTYAYTQYVCLNQSWWKKKKEEKLQLREREREKSAWKRKKRVN